MKTFAAALEVPIAKGHRPPKILFQGDSITDCGREKNEPILGSSAALGGGYASVVGRHLQSAAPDRFEVLNRGLSGNRVVDLYSRWKPDALHLEPDLISILIGVNDTWHEFRSRNGVEVSRYAEIYQMLLEWTRQVLPDVRFVLCEPFVLPCGVVESGWREEIDERRAAVARLARRFDATLVPFQLMFDAALSEAPAAYWAADGVHPTVAGHERMAECWLETTGLLRI